MIEQIVGRIQPLPGQTGTAAGAAGQADGFGNTLQRLVTAVNTTNTEANGAVAKMLDGSGEVHDAMIALQRADLTLQFTVQVKNKLVQAYQEVMRMPV